MFEFNLFAPTSDEYQMSGRIYQHLVPLPLTPYEGRGGWDFLNNQETLVSANSRLDILWSLPQFSELYETFCIKVSAFVRYFFLSKQSKCCFSAQLGSPKVGFRQQKFLS
jgi:hypothetical protein